MVDATGNLRAFERTDDAPFLTVDVAIDKAWSAALFGFATHVWNDYVSNDPKVAPLAYRPRMVAVGGGYPILEDGKLIGGIGISGGTYQQDQDMRRRAYPNWLRAPGVTNALQAIAFARSSAPHPDDKPLSA